MHHAMLGWDDTNKEESMSEAVAEQTLTMEDLFNRFADAGAVEEANRFRVVPKGAYQILVKKYEPRVTKPNEERGTVGGREYASLQCDILNTEGKRQAGVFVNVSWVPGRKADGKQDGMTKLWGNLEKATEMTGKSVGEVLAASTRFPLQAFIDIYFEDQAGKRHYIDSKNGVSPQDQEKAYYEQGFTPGNTVLNISKVK